MNDPYASEEDTLTLLRKDTRTPTERKLDRMLDERGASEQGTEPFLILRQIALELLAEQPANQLDDIDAVDMPAQPQDLVPLHMEWEPGYPEDVAFGTQRQMDRLKKWLDKYFALIQRQAQPQQEPVAYMVKVHGMLQRLSRRADVADELACQYRKDDPNAEVLPLYTSPPAQRKPTDEMVVAAARVLSDRQAAACNVDCGDMWKLHGNDFIDDARAALGAAHGIKENT